MNQEEIGKIIKKIRKDNNLSQQQFADKYGVTYQAVSKWENGKNMPDISTMKMICDDYNLNINDFLDANIKTKGKKRLYIIIAILLTIIILTLLLLKIYNNSNFIFKKVSSTCSEFKVSGSLSYNNQKSAIYISKINYCGEKDDTMYSNIKCILYEKSNNKVINISEYSYNDNITLEKFLSELEFNIDNYSKTCKKYDNNSLYLEIIATKDNKNISYIIPLSLDKC